MKETLPTIYYSGTNSSELEPERQLISSVSHELRTPLAIISSNVQLLRKFNYQLDENIVKETFLLCEEAIESIGSFIDDVHFLNVSYKGELEVNITQVDLEDLFIDFAEKMSLSEFNRNRIKLETNFNHHSFNTDKELLEKILLNVIDNALKFSSETVNLRAFTTDTKLVVEVEDHGIGIPEDELAWILEPFKRSRNAKMITGCGLGMAIVKKCIDVLHGEIEISSELDEGSSVKIKILNQ